MSRKPLIDFAALAVRVPPVVSLAHIEPTAFTAKSHAGLAAFTKSIKGILRRVLVPMRAMRLESIGAIRPISLQILKGGNDAQMRRIDATAIAADVVNHQPFRNGADINLIRNAVCHGLPVGLIREATYVEFPVTYPVHECKPWPALLWAALINLFPETVFHWSSFGGHDRIIAPMVTA